MKFLLREHLNLSKDVFDITGIIHKLMYFCNWLHHATNTRHFLL